MKRIGLLVALVPALNICLAQTPATAPSGVVPAAAPGAATVPSAMPARVPGPATVKVSNDASKANSQEGPRMSFEAEDYITNNSAKVASRLVKNKWATRGTMCQILPGAQIRLQKTLTEAGDYYVFVRCLAQPPARKFSVTFGEEERTGIVVAETKGSGWRWGCIGPFTKNTGDPETRGLVIAPTTGYYISVDVVTICRMTEVDPGGLPVEVFGLAQPNGKSPPDKLDAPSVYLAGIPSSEVPSRARAGKSPQTGKALGDVYEAEEFTVNTLPLPERVKTLSNRAASNGVDAQVLPGAKVMLNIPLQQKGDYYVLVRGRPGGSVRKFSVRFGNTRYYGVALDKQKGPDWRWARVGPFAKLDANYELRQLEIVPFTGYSIFVDAIAISPSIEFSPGGETVESFTALKPMKEPGPEVLDDLQKLSDFPPTYRLQHFIVRASPDRIRTAVGWVRYVDSEIYPTMLNMMGHEPAVNLHVIDFCFRNEHVGVFTGIGRTIEGQTYHASRIYILPSKLDRMPPYQPLGGVVWESIHGLLDEAKRKANWKPIWQTELLDLVFEMELARRLKLDDWSKDLWKIVTKQPKSNYAVLAEFWKLYGWEPYQKLLTQLHEDADFRPTFDQGTYAYQMSMYVEKDVSRFFEERGWDISAEAKRRIREDLPKAATQPSSQPNESQEPNRAGGTDESR